MVHEEKSPAFRAFYRTFFETSPRDQWHDGVDASVVRGLAGEERDEAEDLLIENLGGGGEWAARGLAELKSRKALPLLKEVAHRTAGACAIRAAEAVEAIEGNGEYIPVIIDRLRNAGAWSTRTDAAIALRKFPRDGVVDALFGALLDEDYLVRHHAAESLLAIHGFAPMISAHGDIHGNLVVSNSIDGKPPGEFHAEAVSMLKDLFDI